MVRGSMKESDNPDSGYWPVKYESDPGEILSYREVKFLAVRNGTKRSERRRRNPGLNEPF